MKDRQRPFLLRDVIREAVADNTISSRFHAVSTTCRAAKCSWSTVSKLLAHRALWIRLLRRRSRRKDASAPCVYIARSARRGWRSLAGAFLRAETRGRGG